MPSGSRSGEKTDKSSVLPVNTEALESGQPHLRRQFLAGLPASACLSGNRPYGAVAIAIAPPTCCCSDLATEPTLPAPGPPLAG